MQRILDLLLRPKEGADWQMMICEPHSLPRNYMQGKIESCTDARGFLQEGAFTTYGAREVLRSVLVP